MELVIFCDVGVFLLSVSRMKTDHEVEVRIQPDSDVIRIEGVSEGVAGAKQELLDLVEKMVSFFLFCFGKFFFLFGNLLAKN